MHHIEITHNPFIVETQFVINGQPPAEGCKLTSYKELRLQLWVEKLFDELSRLFNGDDNFQITFTGVESDFLDVKAAAEVAVENGMHVAVEWVKTEPADTRLEKMRLLMDEARSHPKFEACISQDKEMQKSFEEAFDSNFDVHVVATMSAGKSTLINAMLGRDLLPAANEATTATITRVTDDKTIPTFRGTRFDKEGDAVAFVEDMDLKTVEEWNRLEDTLLIDIEGDIQAVQKRDNVRLVLTDTPGPNNSQDEEHARVTMSFIQDSSRNPLILYVLNASQLGTNDDRRLLELVAEAMRKGGKQGKDRFIFVINKMDVFDPEKGEDLPSVLSRVEKYLTENGIRNPLIYPVSANLARLIRKPSDLHSRKERGDFRGMADLFSEEPSMNLLQYMPITSRVSRAVKEKGCSPLMLSSGLPAVEGMIDEYIDKYNLPHRVKRVYDALSRAIEAGLNEASLVAQLEQGEEELARIDDELQILQARRKKGFDAAAYKDKVEREGKILPDSTEQALVELQRQNDEFIRKIAGAFTGSVKPEVAERTMSEAEKDLRFHFKSLVNKYESVFEESQEAIKQDLTAEYRQYVMELFDESQSLDLPVLEGIRKSVSDIALNLSVEDSDLKTKSVKIGSRTVKTSKWYKPWTWGDTEDVGIYENQTYVDQETLWKERQTRIRAEFSKLVKSARKRIDGGKDTLVDKFLKFMGQEFDEKFSALLTSIEEKVHDRTAREQALQEAKNQQNWIATFKSKLDATLAMEPAHDNR
jgi:ribosome biogenesis GTPase A